MSHSLRAFPHAQFFLVLVQCFHKAREKSQPHFTVLKFTHEGNEVAHVGPKDELSNAVPESVQVASIPTAR